MEWYIYPALILAGFFAGFINTLAGSGSLITLPLLMFLGLPANVANGTNRIAILLQNVVGSSSFNRKKLLEPVAALDLIIPAIAGSIAGAFIAVDLNEEIMEKTIGGLLLFMFFLLILKPSAWLKKQQSKSPLSRPLRIFIFFLIGAYGGFIQAGVGFFLLSGLVLGAGYDLLRANALKVFIILCYTVFALGVFIVNDQVNFVYGLILSVGNMGGALVGARTAIKRGPEFVRYLLLVTVLISSLKLLNVF